MRGYGGPEKNSCNKLGYNSTMKKKGSEAWKSYDVEATLMEIAIVNPRFVGIYGAPRSMVTLIIFNISIISGTASPSEISTDSWGLLTLKYIIKSCWQDIFMIKVPYGFMEYSGNSFEWILISWRHMETFSGELMVIWRWFNGYLTGIQWIRRV